MAEALAAVGIVASIAQLADLGSKVLGRLNEYHSKIEDAPRSIRNVQDQLPLLLKVLEDTQRSLDSGVIQYETERALVPVIDGCRFQIKSLEAIVDKLPPQSGESWMKKSKKAISSLKQDSNMRKIASALERYVLVLTFWFSALGPNSLKDTKLTEIRAWLSAPDPSINYQRGLKLRQAGTGLWFLQSDGYSQWRTGDASFIWLHGIPGCGKTILSSTIIEDILGYCLNDPLKAVAYFYMDFKDPEKQSSELMIKSLVMQLCQQCLRIPSVLNSLFISSNPRQPSSDALLNTLRQVCGEFVSTYIILDALDECANQEELLSTLETVAGWHLESLHIIATSRKVRDFEESLDHLTDFSISLQSVYVNEDIRTYVHHRLTVDKKLTKWRRHELGQEVVTAITGGAQGMFRWAVCQLDSLRHCVTPAMLRKSLVQFPPTLDETYERILCAIPKEYSALALCMLRWLSFSLRPLSLEEVAEVVAIKPEKRPALHNDDVLLDPLDALTICASLVTLSAPSRTGSAQDYYTSSSETALANDYEPAYGLHGESFNSMGHEGRILTLAHYSVKEYLTSDRILDGPAKFYHLQENDSKAAIANSCIGYVLQLQVEDPFMLNLTTGHRLAQYAAEFWIDHARPYSFDGTYTQELILELFKADGHAFLNWTYMHDIDQPFRSYQREWQANKVASPLYYASLAGFSDIAKILVHAEDRDINAHAGRYGNVLQAAAASTISKPDLVKLLLECGADVNAKGGLYGCALQAASAQSSDCEVVKLLLRHGADVNRQSIGVYSSALEAAIWKNDKEIIKLLLDAGADVEAQSSNSGTVLQLASSKSNPEVVKLLLDYGADVNTKGSNDSNALQQASASWHSNPEVVKLLLDAGANVNAQTNGEYGNALRAATAVSGDKINLKVVKLLLDRGADVNATSSGEFAHALEAASASAFGNPAVIKLLLDYGANINAQGGKYDNALQATLESKYSNKKDLVPMLLEHGADINAQGGTYGNALQAAVWGMHKDLVELLINHGANVNAQGGFYGSALQAAADRGDWHADTVKLLLDCGANVNAQGGFYGNALQAASFQNSEHIVQLLLDCGADINAQGGEYGSALQAISAREWDHREVVVKLLLDSGADVNAQGGKHGNALEAALQYEGEWDIGQKKVVDLLLERGAVRSV